ncbi:MAG: ABC transporter substrate-binding protein [Anaerolineae bacterium]
MAANPTSPLSIWCGAAVGQDHPLVALNDYIEKSAVDLSDFYASQLGVVRYDDTYYGLPVSTNNLELFYNKDLFTAAGLDPDKPPTTWDELESMAKQCAKPEEGIGGMELYTEPGEGLTWQYQVYLWQAGGSFLSDDLKSAAFNSEAGAKALQFWVDMLQNGAAPQSPWGLFGQGKGCMVMDGSWMVGIWAKDAAFQWGTALMPIPTDGKAATNMGGEHLILFQSDAERQQAAWNFVNWLTSTDVQVKWDQRDWLHADPRSCRHQAAFTEWLDKTEPRLKAFVESQKYAINRPPVANYAEISDAFSRELEKALLGEVDGKPRLPMRKRQSTSYLLSRLS